MLLLARDSRDGIHRAVSCKPQWAEGSHACCDLTFLNWPLNKVKAAIAAIDEGDYTTGGLMNSQTDPAVVTRVLLKYFESLPSHLLGTTPCHCHSHCRSRRCESAGATETAQLSEAADAEEAAEVVSTLPDLERQSLTYFVSTHVCLVFPLL